jgi:hypothetical protein
MRTVVARYFNGVMGWVLNLIGLVSLFVSIKFPVLPIWVGVAVLLINAFLAAFLVWREEARHVKAIEAELQKIKDSIPRYKINIGDVKKYTVQDIIDVTCSKISELEKKLEASKTPETSAVGSNFTGLAASLQMIKQLQTSVLPTMRSLGYESEEDKLARLKKYHSRLLKHEDKLKHLYQVSLSIESTRHDKNIEIEIESNDTFAMTVEDDYESNKLPVEDSRSDYSWLSNMNVRPMAVASKYYLQSSAKNNKAISELAYINATRPTNVFDSTFYIHSKKEEAQLLIKVHSTKLMAPQAIKGRVSLTHIPVIQISRNSSND